MTMVRRGREAGGARAAKDEEEEEEAEDDDDDALRPSLASILLVTSGFDKTGECLAV